MGVALPREEPRGRLTRARVALPGGAATTVYATSHPERSTELRVAILRKPQKLAPWCAARGVQEALVGGFFVRPGGMPLGEVRTRGVARRHVPFAPPWGDVRACVNVQRRQVRIAQRDELPAAAARRPPAGRPAARARRRARASTARWIPRASRPARRSSTPTSPTAATRARRSGSRAAASSRSPATAARAATPGLTLEELAALLVALGCHTALNLDGGGSTSLVSGGRLRNRPRGDYERPSPAAGRSRPRCCSCRAELDLDLQQFGAARGRPAASCARSRTGRAAAARARGGAVAVVARRHQHVGGERREAGGHLPDVEVVDLDDAGHGGRARGRSPRGPCPRGARLEQHAAGVAQQAQAARSISSGDEQRRDRRPPGRGRTAAPARRPSPRRANARGR